MIGAGQIHVAGQVLALHAVRSALAGGAEPPRPTDETGKSGRHGLAALGAMAVWAAALWPHWQWVAARLNDGSDDPLGVAALVVLGFAVWRLRGSLVDTPRRSWLWLALGASGIATAALWTAPPLVGALLAALAMAACLCAFLPAGHARLPLAGLAVLALPVVSSLQFYAGHPLRIVTAQASTWILQAAGLAAQRSGTAMQVEGRLVIVDAPCSGVQMVWMAYFCACAVAALLVLPDRHFARRLPAVGAVVLCGNVLRNSVLVALEALRAPGAGPAGLAGAQAPTLAPAGLSASAWNELLHQGVGLAVLLMVCAAVVALMRTPALRAREKEQCAPGHPLAAEGHGHARIGSAQRVVAATVLMVCALTPMGVSARLGSATPATPVPAGEWPSRWDGRPLRPLALSPIEQRFAARFPGRIARFTDGTQVVVLRDVNRPTRMLHPAADCYRGLGFRIEQARLEHDAQGLRWRCFMAEREGRRTRVCERIVDANGQAFTDASSWFWAAQLGQSSGPWLAVTTASAL